MVMGKHDGKDPDQPEEPKLPPPSQDGHNPDSDIYKDGTGDHRK
ncbi:hypothetical protein [Streptomyces sp. SAJ15]|nr:hypothetical protein [Streptomyces sp. SAJ15]